MPPSLAERIAASHPTDARQQVENLEGLRSLRQQLGVETNAFLVDCLEAAILLTDQILISGGLGCEETIRICSRLVFVVERNSVASSAPASRSTSRLRAPASGTPSSLRMREEGHGAPVPDSPPPASSAPAHVPPSGAAGAAGGAEVNRQLTVINDMLLGEILVQFGMVRPAAVERALALQAEKGLRFGEALVASGGATEADVEAGIRFQHRLRETRRATSAEKGRKAVAPRDPEAMEHPRESVLRGLEDFLLGEILRRRGFATQADIAKALEVHTRRGIPIGEALISLGTIRRDQVEAALAFQAQLRKRNGNGPGSA